MLSILAAMAITAPIDMPVVNSIYEYTVNDIDGKKTPLEKFKGKVLVVVNVASKCGLTPQYAGLEKLYIAKKSEGLVVLGFPANEFNGQEPGTNAEIKEFCTGKYNVTFPMFSKIVVKGDEIHPLYKWLVESTPNKDAIEWNFAKFVVGRDGKVVARFAPQTKPDDAKFIATVDAALAAK